MAVSQTKFAQPDVSSFGPGSAPASVGESDVVAAPEAGPPSVEETLAYLRARIDFLEHRMYVMETKQKGTPDE